MRRFLVPAIVLVAITLAAPVCRVGFHTIPWLLMPVEDPITIAHRFAEVTADVELTLGDLDGLEALDAASFESLSGDDLSYLALDQRTPEQRAAILALQQWAQRGGEIPSPGCAPHPEIAPRVARLHATASAALHTVTGPDDPLLLASTRVASQLAARGDAAQARAGLELAAQIRRVAHARGWSLPAEVAAAAPRREDLRRGLARTAWCLAEHLRRDSRFIQVSRPAGLEADAPWPALGLAWCKRERLVVQQFYGDMLQHDSWQEPQLTVPHCEYAARRLPEASAFIVGREACREVGEIVALLDEIGASS